MSVQALQTKLVAAELAVANAVARVEKLKEEIANYANRNPAVGSVVQFKQVRTDAILTGTVVAVKEDGTFIKVQVGTGFDAEFSNVRPAAIVSVLADETPVAETEGVVAPV